MERYRYEYRSSEVPTEERILECSFGEVGEEPRFCSILNAMYELAYFTAGSEGADGTSEGRLHSRTVRATSWRNQHAKEGVAARRTPRIYNTLESEDAFRGEVAVAISVERHPRHGAVAWKNKVR